MRPRDARNLHQAALSTGYDSPRSAWREHDPVVTEGARRTPCTRVLAVELGSATGPGRGRRGGPRDRTRHREQAAPRLGNHGASPGRPGGNAARPAPALRSLARPARCRRTASRSGCLGGAGTRQLLEPFRDVLDVGSRNEGRRGADPQGQLRELLDGQPPVSHRGDVRCGGLEGVGEHFEVGREAVAHEVEDEARLDLEHLSRFGASPDRLDDHLADQSQPVLGLGPVGDGRGEPFPQIILDVAADGFEHLFLAVEIAVEGAARHAGVLADVAHGQLAVAVPRECAQRSVEDAFDGRVRGHAAWAPSVCACRPEYISPGLELVECRWPGPWSTTCLTGPVVPVRIDRHCFFCLVVRQALLDEERRELGLKQQLFIDGKWTDGSGGGVVGVVNPATEVEFARVPVASVSDVDDAVGAARRAFDEGPWGRTSPRDRARFLSRFADVISDRMAEIVDLTIAEAGSPRKLSETLQTRVPLDHLRDMADRVLSGFPFERAMPPTFGVGIGQGVVLREPAGVVAAITPFNYPFYVDMLKVVPALAAGCTMVLKPSPYTPLAAMWLAGVAEEAELPPGVLNVVTGDLEAGRRLTTHPDVDVVTFTGSDVVGAKISEQAAGGIKKVILELGGKSANIVLEDADLDRVIPHAAYGFTRHSGQGCACLTRVLVHRSRYEEVVERLAAQLGTLKVGDPDAGDTDMGPLIREAQRERVERYVRIGQEEGARLVSGGGRPAGLTRGFYHEPTLFADVTPSMRIAREEIFGPVGVVLPFADDGEAAAIANDSDFGLSGAVWSRDTQRGYALARRIRTGMVYLNGGGGGTNPHGPFGGYKRSGIGREFGEAAVEEYLESKSVMWGVA